jgi:cell wall-associated NlpC family hydrolase
MKPYFEQKERQAALEAEASRWEGTPYFANAASRGHGVGCVELVHELWVAVGAIPRLELPRYQTDFAHHSTQTQLLRFLLDHPALHGRLLFTPWLGRRLPGDLFGVRAGQVDHHLACALRDGRVVHAVQPSASHRGGVIINREADDAFARRVLYVLRLMEEAT